MGAPGPHQVGVVSDFIVRTQASGRITFTLRDIARDVPTAGRALEAALRRQSIYGAIRRVSPRTGFFVIVPPEYRGMGCPPVEWWLGDLMAFLGAPYYLGLFSAAALHGSSHFAVMETQVVTLAWIRPIRVGRTRIRFLQRGGVERMPVDVRQGAWGPLRVAAPETLAVDLFRRAPCAVDRAALTLAKLRPRLGRRRLAEALDAAADVPGAQRLSFVLEWLGLDPEAASVERWLAGRPRRLVRLEPGAGQGTLRTHARWNIQGDMPAGILAA